MAQEPPINGFGSPSDDRRRNDPPENDATVEYQPGPESDRATKCPICLASFPWPEPKHTHGKFDFVKCVGRGGLGEVWLAKDNELHRDVALKAMRSDHASSLVNPYAEGRKSAQLHHSNIAQVYEVAVLDDVAVLVSRFVDGVTLKQAQSVDRPNERVAARLVAELAELLHYAHENGICHLDVKPGNVMLESLASATDARGAPRFNWGSPFLLDFGLASRVGDDRVLGGTPAYMSPEQAEGMRSAAADAEPKTPVGRESDIYSLGAVLYELLTGEPPPPCPTDSKQRVSPRTKVRSVSRNMDAICAMAMRRNPCDRYRTGREMANDLRRYLDGYVVQARANAFPFEGLYRWAKRQWGYATLLALIVLLFFGAFGGVLLTYRDVLDQRDKVIDEKRRTLAQKVIAEEAKDQSEIARRKAESKSYQAIVENVRYSALAPSPGWRKASLDAIRDASRLDVPERDALQLRALAAGCLAGVDLVRAGSVGEGFAPGRIAFSPNGELLAIGEHRGYSTSLLIFDVKERRERRRLSVDSLVLALSQSGVRAVAFSPDSRFVAAGTRGGRALVWDLQSDRDQPIALELHKKAIFAIAFDASGKLLAFGDRDGTMTLWSVDDWKRVAKTELGHPFESLAFAKGGAILEAGVSFDDGSSVVRWEIRREKDGAVELGPSDRKSTPHSAIGYAKDELLFRAGSHVFFHRFGNAWKISALAKPTIAGAGAVAEPLNDVSFDHQGYLAASAGVGAHPAITLWEPVASREVLSHFVAGDNDVRCAFSPTERLLAVALPRRTELYRVEGLDSRSILARNLQPIKAMAISFDGKQLVCYGESPYGLHPGEVSTWNVDTAALVQLQAMPQAVYTENSPGHLLLGASRKALVQRAGKLVEFGLDSGESRSLPHGFDFSPCRSPHSASYFGVREAMSSRIVEWDLRTHRELRSWENSDLFRGNAAVTSLDAGRTTLGFGTAASGVGIINLKTFAPERRWGHVGSAARCLALDPNESSMVVGFQLGDVRVFRRAGPGEPIALRGFPTVVRRLRFDSSGQWLAAAAGREIRLWKRLHDTFVEAVTLTERGDIDDIQFHPNRPDLYVLERNDSCVRVWRLDRLRDSWKSLNVDVD